MLRLTSISFLGCLATLGIVAPSMSRQPSVFPAPKTLGPVETYGANAYLPRFPKEARITRIDVSALSTRNPLPNVQEIQAPFHEIEARKPRFIVVTDAWVWRYFALGASGGRVVPPEQAERERDQATRAYFQDLHMEALEYRVVHLSRFSSSFWPTRQIHQSTAKDIRIFERKW